MHETIILALKPRAQWTQTLLYVPGSNGPVLQYCIQSFSMVPGKQNFSFHPKALLFSQKICLAKDINAHCTSLAVLFIWGRKISVEQKNLTNNSFLRLLEGTGIAWKILDLNSLKNIRKKD
jgi:hypothetical protein